MSLNIEPRLQTIIDDNLGIARQTFAKDVPDTESLATSILLMLAGQGLPGASEAFLNLFGPFSTFNYNFSMNTPAQSQYIHRRARKPSKHCK